MTASCAPSSDLALCGAGSAAVAGGLTFGTIAAAVSSGASVVSVCPGTYEVALSIDGIALQSASGDPSDTVLSGGGTHPIVYATNAQVYGLSFVDGYSTYAGGALEGRHTDVHCSVFEDNVADYQGGALQLRGDSTIVGTVFRGNHAGYEGGAISWGDWEDYTLVIEGSTFEQNTADYSGGAIEIGTWSYDTVSITNSTYLDNNDTSSTGVVAFGSWGGFDAVIDGCAFAGNDQAIGLNGWLQEGYTIAVTDTSITGDPGNSSTR